MAIYICEYCNDYKDGDYDPCESVGKYDSICGNCSVEHFNEEGEENDDRECS